MSQVRKTAKLFVDMFLLKAKPSAAPSSYALVFALCTFFILSKVAIYLGFIHIYDRFDPKDTIHITYFGAALIAMTWLLLLSATLRSTLSYYKLVDRFLKTFTSILAMDCILNVIYLIWLAVLGFSNLPDVGDKSLTSLAIILGFIAMMYWQFRIYMNILLDSMNISLLQAGVFTLFYLLLQHNLSEMLLNALVTVVMVDHNAALVNNVAGTLNAI